MGENGRTEAFRVAEGRLLDHYGVAARSRWVGLREPALRTRVLEAGEGPPLLLLPGGGAFAGLWAPLMAELSGVRLLAVDRPGFGLADPVSYRGVDVCRHAVTFLDSVLDALDLDSVPVVANSMGALWSLWLALERPQRVERLALLGCPALLLDTSAPAPMRLQAVRGLGRLMLAAERPSPGSARRLLRRMGHVASARSLPDELVEAMAAHARLSSFPEAWLSLLHACLSLRGARPHLRFGEEHARRVEQPVHFVWGSGDPFGPVAVGERAVELLPRASLEQLGEGHLPWLDEPVAIGAVVRRFVAPAPSGASAPARPERAVMQNLA